eukprot:5776147-Pleurochrysis_carterae.AAC.1
MCGVETFTNKQQKELRICATSLEALATFCPSEHPFPAQIPETHKAVVARTSTIGAQQQPHRVVAEGGGAGRGGGRSGPVWGSSRKKRTPDSSDDEEESDTSTGEEE